MLDTFLEHPFFLNRYRQAPLLKERDSFLNHLQQQGTSRKALRNLSAELLQVVRLLKLTQMRDVSLEEIQRAASCWARQQRTNPKAHSYGNSASSFIYAAKKWLRFHGRLKLPSAPPMRFAYQLGDFARYMTEEKGLSPYSVRSHCAQTSRFLEWFGERHRLLARARVEDVDQFLAMKGVSGWNRKSVSVAAQALRAFFRYAETHGWCAAGFAKGIEAPKIYKYEGLPEGPSWEEVRRLLKSVKGSGPAVLRARAILSLLGIYGLRSGEVSRADEAAQLTVGDLRLRGPQEKSQSFVQLRGKGNKIRFCPLWASTTAVLKELVTRRAEQERVFLGRSARAMTRFGVHDIVTRHARMARGNRAGLRLKRIGPHTIRHTTATHLLRAGVDINTIRAWLGHVSIDTTNIYAESDLEMKAKALGMCETKLRQPRKRWRDNPDLLKFLAQL